MSLVMVGCDSGDIERDIDGGIQRDLLYSFPFQDSIGQPNLAAAMIPGFIMSVVGLTQFAVGGVVKMCNINTPDKYSEEIKKIQNQLSALSDQIDHCQADLTLLLKETALESRFGEMNREVNKINSAYADLNQLLNCANSTKPMKTCVKEKMTDLFSHSNRNDVDVALRNLIDQVQGTAQTTPIYEAIVNTMFDATVTAGKSPSPAAKSTFKTLMDTYAYISGAQMLGYIYYLNYYNYDGQRDSELLDWRPQNYSSSLAKQTDKFWHAIEEISVFGLYDDYSATGARMDYDQGNTGWENWCKRRYDTLL